MNSNVSLDDRQMITDLLNSQKFVTSVYNGFCCEAATSEVRSCLSTILQEEHRIQEELFNEMSAKGWYPVEKAEENKLQSAKQTYSQTVTV